MCSPGRFGDLAVSAGPSQHFVRGDRAAPFFGIRLSPQDFETNGLALGIENMVAEVRCFNRRDTSGIREVVNDHHTGFAWLHRLACLRI